VLGIEGETQWRKSWRKRRRRARISLLNHGSSFLSDFKSNGTPTGVPDFSYIPKGQKKTNDPAPNSHNRKRQPEARERQRSEKRDPTENPLQYHKSTITEETDNNTNVSVMSNTVAHNIPSFPIKLSFLAFFFFA
jgi:hypothetical protein